MAGTTAVRSPMPPPARSRVRIVASGLGLGTLWGGALGALTMLGLALVFWSEAEVLELGLPIAAIVGAALGGIDGLFAGLVLAVARNGIGPSRDRVRLVGAAASAAPAFELVLLSLGNGGGGWWGWWTFVGVLAASAGAILAPRVVYGRTRRPPTVAHRHDEVPGPTSMGTFA